METEREKELWKLAKKRVGFKRHFAVYIVVNSMFWLLWYFTDHRAENSGLPWPIIPTIGWGIGVAVNFLNAYVFNKHDAIEKEYEKLKNR